jgi:hypothetical protein
MQLKPKTQAKTKIQHDEIVLNESHNQSNFKSSLKIVSVDEFDISSRGQVEYKRYNVRALKRAHIMLTKMIT